ncbi:pyruvate, water dikinase regulatory protein [Pseudemcibacter aquimaris]|uniref:pyruvate, water dikinase regulatory protein n=1 Tax=Pseudemcibacter aquimaris TaxID=2857064 RepID=UPI0020133449|nr:pyruvate, water dikinase regulatory protein [Pseudemcibacter aquimaris]MCC3861828.1 kinase/pyrophosphorylase [Pseudemcibacter aquimaris]WDU58583.1 kinase/pyrophosphorylase [Pseudemcibacter aquimaris]
MKKIHLHLVSDSTGDTLEQVAKAALAQFPGIETVKHYWPMIRTARHMARIIAEMEENPGVVMFTLVDHEIEKVLVDSCKKHGWRYISVLHGIIRELGRHVGEKPSERPGLQHQMDDEYFDRIDAIQYTLAHDDGQIADNLMDADIILVGVSRTSKTPTCIYLANRGYRAANIPIVPGLPLPQDLERAKAEGKFIVGLVNSVDRLVQIRRNRLLTLKETKTTDYVDEDLVKEEVKESRRLFTKMGWPVIDVTRRSIEETSVAIINLKNKYDEEMAAKK